MVRKSVILVSLCLLLIACQAAQPEVAATPVPDNQMTFTYGAKNVPVDATFCEFAPRFSATYEPSGAPAEIDFEFTGYVFDESTSKEVVSFSDKTDKEGEFGKAWNDTLNCRVDFIKISTPECVEPVYFSIEAMKKGNGMVKSCELQ